MTNVLFVCTGNAARSVMAVVMARARAPELSVRGAGTFSIPGLPMSQRTREALKALGLRDLDHRSKQLDAADTRWADLIVVFEAEHVAYIRRQYSEAAAHTACLPRLVRDLDTTKASLAERLSELQLADVEIQAWEEVIDPAGGDLEVFHRCAAEISDMIDDLLPKISTTPEILATESDRR